MAKINQKYLKDENGDIFSPITSTQSVYDAQGEPLNNVCQQQLIFEKTFTDDNTHSFVINNLDIGVNDHLDFIMDGRSNKYR